MSDTLRHAPDTYSEPELTRCILYFLFTLLTHNRGYITPLAGFRFPGMLSSDLAFADIPAGLEGLRMVPTAGLAQIAIFIACMEIGTSTFNGKGEFLGDYTMAPGMDKFRWDTKSADWKYKKMQIELNNGRAAQMGILGLVTHELMGNLNEVLYV